MIKNVTGDCFWDYEVDSELRLFFVGSVQTGGYEVLADFRAFEEEEFLAIAILIGERQHLWAEWQTIAQKLGGDALCQHIFSLHEKDPFENFLGVGIIEGQIKSRGVTVSVQLRTRRVDLLRYVFQSSDLQSAFIEWVNASDLGELVDLSLIGLLQGRNALVQKMDQIATAQLLPKAGLGHAVMKAVEEALGVRTIKF